MARFRATLQGNRGEVSRLGSKASGMSAHINGWNTGVTIYAGVDDQGQDEFYIYLTGGSNGRISKQLIGVVVDDPETGPEFNIHLG